MICPFLTTDVNDLKPCIDTCALCFKNFCSFNAIAQTMYHNAKAADANRQKDHEKASDLQE